MILASSGSRVLPTAPDEGRIRSALDCGRSGCDCTRGPNTHCPGPSHARGDRDPSLTIHERGGTVLVNCKGGCSQDDVIAALQARDLWPRAESNVLRLTAGRAERRERGPAPKLVSTTIDEIKNADGIVQAEHVRKDYDDGSKDTHWQLPGERNGLSGRKVVTLPLYGMETLSAIADGATAALCEGEKATKAARALGLNAVGTVTGAATIPADDVLKPLTRFDLVIWPDHDDEGRKHMRRIAERVVALGGRVRMLHWPDARDKGDDAADFLERGGTPEQAAELVAAATVFDPIAERLASMPIINAVDLAAMQFSEPKVIVQNLLVEGATMLVSPGKSGKSRLMMGISVGVAHGGAVLGSIGVEGGDVLYLALEDGKRRGRSRMLEACSGNVPARLDLMFECPTMDAGGLEMIESWLMSKPGARLVVVDTLKRFRARTNGRRNAYDEDYEALAPLNDLALRYGVCIVIVHHTNKIRLSDDPTDRASGSTGMLAAVDGMIVMERTRGQADAVLHVFHRDLEDGKFAIKSDQELGWRFLGDAAEYARTELQDEIVNVILESGRPLKPGDVATALDRDRKLTGTAMWKMTKPNANGLQILISQGGYYWPASRPWPGPEDDDDENPGNRGNRGNRDYQGNQGNQANQEELFKEDEPVSPVSSNGETRETGPEDSYQEGPVSPVSPVSPVAPVWRCACGCYERKAQSDGLMYCQKCKALSGVI